MKFTSWKVNNCKKKETNFTQIFQSLPLPYVVSAGITKAEWWQIILHILVHLDYNELCVAKIVVNKNESRKRNTKRKGQLRSPKNLERDSKLVSTI